jgi:beta-mannanase
MYHTLDGSFQILFSRKYATLAQFHKPIIIAECGVSVSEDQTSWIAGMRQSVGAFPLLHTIVYFNAQDGYAWVNGTKPDWRLRDSDLWGVPLTNSRLPMASTKPFSSLAVESLSFPPPRSN